jgi:3-hydroxy acid dehydrogenase / malonic semialdehyde reductase
VIGATSGFGLAIAKRFAQARHSIIAGGRRRDRLRTLVVELGEERVHPLENE